MPFRKPDLASVLDRDWWEGNNWSKVILNQKFATVLRDEDLSNAEARLHKGFKSRPRMPASMKSSGSSEVKLDEEGFSVSLDLDEFEVGDLTVRRIDRTVEVHGKHPEKRDQYGLVSREFRRHYMLPPNCDIEAVTASLSTDRQLTIQAPVIRQEQRFFDGSRILLVEDAEPTSPVTELKQEDLREITLQMVQKCDELLNSKEEDTPEMEDSEHGSKMEPKDYAMVEKLMRETFHKFRVTEDYTQIVPETDSDSDPTPNKLLVREKMDQVF